MRVEEVAITGKALLMALRNVGVSIPEGSMFWGVENLGYCESAVVRVVTQEDAPYWSEGAPMARIVPRIWTTTDVLQFMATFGAQLLLEAEEATYADGYPEDVNFVPMHPYFAEQLKEDW